METETATQATTEVGEEPVAVETQPEEAEVPVKAKRGRKPGSANAPKKDRPTAGATPAHTNSLGSSAFPISKVAKIIKADKEIALCQKEAVFLISVATEHFIKRLTDAAYTRARMDQSKTIRYKVLSGACAPEAGDIPGDFFFLEDVISKATHAHFLPRPANKD